MAKPCKYLTAVLSAPVFPISPINVNGEKKKYTLGHGFYCTIEPRVFDFVFKSLYSEVSINTTIIFILPWDFYDSTLTNMDSTFQKIL